MAEATIVYVFPIAAGQRWIWHVKDSGGNVVASSHAERADEEGARLQVEDLVDALWDNVEPDYVEEGSWHWVLVSNEELRGRSSRAFADRSEAQNDFELVKTMLTRRLDFSVPGSSDA